MDSDFFFLGQPLHRRRPDPVAADHLAHQAFVRKTTHPFGLFVADAHGVNHRQIARLPRRQKARLHRLEQTGGFHQATGVAHQAHGAAVIDQVCGLRRAHEFGTHHVQRFTSNGAAPFFIAILAITPRLISLVPSKMR